VNWLAILLALAGIGATPATKAEPVKKQCKTASAKKACKPATKPKKPVARAKKPVARGKKPAPTATATPAPRAGDGDAPAATRPEATPTPAATPVRTPGAGTTPTPVATPTATPVTYPRRTAVDLLEWDIRSSYHTLGAGRITFNANNLGEDDHDLAVRMGNGPALGKLELAPLTAGPLAVDLTAGSYVLYCSLLGHEAAGMRLAITVK
jgi:hypothetical protein